MSCRLPQIAWAVQWVWDDPRRIPYLLVWNSNRNGEVKEAVRVARFAPQSKLQEADAVVARRMDGSSVPIYLVRRRQPNGGRSLLYDAGGAKSRAGCCTALRLEMTGVITSPSGPIGNAARALSCATPPKEAIFAPACDSAPSETYPRPELWLPYGFTSPQKAVEAGFCAHS